MSTMSISDQCLTTKFLLVKHIQDLTESNLVVSPRNRMSAYLPFFPMRITFCYIVHILFVIYETFGRMTHLHTIMCLVEYK